MHRKLWYERILRSLPETNAAPAPEPHEGDPAPSSEPPPAGEPTPAPNPTHAKETQYGDTDNTDTTPATEIEKPEWVSDKYWDPEKYVKDGQIDYVQLAEDQAKANAEAQRKIFTKNEDLKNELRQELEQQATEGIPEDPTGYELKFSKDVLPDDVELNVDDNDPVLNAAKQWAHENGLNQDQFTGLMDLYASQKLGEMPVWQAEDGKSGEGDKLGPNADQRLARVEAFAKEYLPKEDFEFFASLPATAGMVRVFEGVMRAAGAKDYTPNDPNPVGYMTKEELKTLQATKEYQNGDPAMVRKVSDGYAALARARQRG